MGEAGNGGNTNIDEMARRLRERFEERLGDITEEVVDYFKELAEEILVGSSVAKIGNIDDPSRSWPVGVEMLSPVLVREGTSRPVVLSLTSMLLGKPVGEATSDVIDKVVELQESAGLKADGVVGKNTWREIFHQGFVVSPVVFRAYEWICWVEAGTRQNAFGFAEDDIGDGAGANYGVIQYNSRGSMERLLKSAGQEKLLGLYNSRKKDKVSPEIKAWIGSSVGIRAQIKDFEDHIFAPACRNLDEWIKVQWSKVQWWVIDRAKTLMVDFKVQNGSLISPYRLPDWDLFHKYWAEYAPKYGLGKGDADKIFAATKNGDKARDRNRSATEKMLELIVDKVGSEQDRLQMSMIGLAIYRGACSHPKYAARVIDRKLAVATGTGKIHGSDVSLRRMFGLG